MFKEIINCKFMPLMYVYGVISVHSILQYILEYGLVVGLSDVLICRKYKQINVCL